MKIVSVVGARPQFIKLFPIVKSIPDGVVHDIIHTGQHYDDSMSQVFFNQLGIPYPNRNLNVGSGTHAQQTSSMMTALEEEFMQSRPDVVLVYGDTNSTLAASIAASKINIPVAHLEAGLRSFNRRMPEELNRIVADHVADILLAPTSTAMANLQNEGLGSKSVFVGDVMVDAINLSQKMTFPIDVNLPNEYIYVTIHRAENTETKSRILEILRKLEMSEVRALFVIHPRLRAKCAEFQIELSRFDLTYLEPQPYLQNLNLIKNALGVITDSGGIQKEAYLLGTNVLTIRNETEWVETLQGNCNVLDYDLNLVSTEWYTRVSIFDQFIFGDGNSAFRSIQALLAFLEKTS